MLPTLRMTLVITLMIAAAIAVLTLLPLSDAGLPAPGSEKLHHFIAFMALVLPSSLYRPACATWVAPTALLFGAAIELAQPFVGRSFSTGDIAADAAGAASGAAVGTFLHFASRYSSKRRDA